jgi:hypothetical protein
VLDVVADRLLGTNAGDIMGVVGLISLAAGINAWTFAGPRLYFAMARDGVFFPAVARVHPKYKTPAVSVAAQAGWATLLILTGSLDKLTTYVGFALTLFARIAVAAVFVLRAREPNAPRPFKALGYPITPAIFRDCQRRDGPQCNLQRSRNVAHGRLRHCSRHPIVFVVQQQNTSGRRVDDRYHVDTLGLNHEAEATEFCPSCTRGSVRVRHCLGC